MEPSTAYIYREGTQIDKRACFVFEAPAGSTYCGSYLAVTSLFTSYLAEPMSCFFLNLPVLKVIIPLNVSGLVEMTVYTVVGNRCGQEYRNNAYIK